MFSLAPLPYAHDALAPTIDAETMQIHHGKHHQAYVDNLNKALDGHNAGADLISILGALDALPESVRGAVRNNGGGHANHSMFWNLMRPQPQAAPTGELKAALEAAFGDMAQLQEKFNDGGVKRFGSGWVFVVFDPKGGALSIQSYPNQDTPLMEGKFALFGNDVWEHAYYLSYRNRRADYLKAWWNVLDWAQVEQRYAQLKAGEKLI